MNFRRIGTKMLVIILPVMILAQVVLTIISAITSNDLVETQTNQTMESELDANILAIEDELNQVKVMANSISVTVANTYKFTEWKDYEKLLTEMINSNDIVLGSGLWFEPYAYDAEEKYIGPYVYKDGGSVVTTWDYSNAEYDYFSQEYYTSAMSQAEPQITDPYYDETSGTIMSSCSAPILVNGKAIGCVTVDITLTTIEEMVGAVSVGETGSGMLTTGSGVFLAGVDESLIQQAAIITENANASLASMGQEILANELGDTQYKNDSGTSYNVYYNTIPGVNWKFMVQIETKELQRPIFLMINKLILVCIVAVAIAVLVIIRAIGGLAKAIQKVQNFARNLAGGDFTINRLDVRGRDELALMSESLNEMYGNNKEVIQNISDHSIDINAASEKLKVSAEDLKMQFDKIADVMSDINSNMMNTSAATEELTASVDQVSQSTEVLNQETKTSLGLAVEIQKRAEDIGKTSQEAFNTAQTLRESYETKLEESIAQSKVVENIGQMASVISDIADQITLLSLNASIEAARAGEQGKGFAVVATEIGKLAGETAHSVESIQETIQSVQKAFEGLAKNAKVLLEFVTDTVTPDYKNFVGVAEQYGKDAEAIKGTSEKLDQMTDSIQEIMSEISCAIQNIAESTQKTAENSSEIMDSVENVSEVVIEINDMSDKQSDISSDLTSVVHKFRLAVGDVAPETEDK